MKLLVACIFLVGCASAQIHVGIKAGVPLTDITETISTSTVLKDLSSRWTVGPMVEVDLPFGFGVEVNALYRRVGYEVASDSGGPPSEQNERFTGGLWDFPLIAKYRFDGTDVRPYVGAGWTYRRINDLLRFRAGANGFVLVGGLKINALALSIAPEVRYTRWAHRDVEPGFRANKDQAEILVGITF